MFESAVLKLTAWYVGALMLVCLLFSIPIYNIAADRLRIGAERQTEVVRRMPNRFMTNDIFAALEAQREKQIIEDRRNLINSIIVTNLIITSAGAAASYLFARRTLQPLEDYHEAQVRFTSDASHELRTPLAVMQTEIEVALRDKNLSSSQAKEILSSNLEEVARLKDLSDQLLSLTKPKTELKLKTIKIRDFLENEIVKLTKRYDVIIKLVINKDRNLKVDPTLLSQAIDIIVKNAVTYSGKKEVEIKADKYREQTRIIISDKGKGINPKDLPYIFDRFYRGSNVAKDNPKGHGLGLSLAKEIINRHGGDINVTSRINKGTKFTITL